MVEAPQSIYYSRRRQNQFSQPNIERRPTKISIQRVVHSCRSSGSTTNGWVNYRSEDPGGGTGREPAAQNAVTISVARPIGEACDEETNVESERPCRSRSTSITKLGRYKNRVQVESRRRRGIDRGEIAGSINGLKDPRIEFDVKADAASQARVGTAAAGSEAAYRKRKIQRKLFLTIRGRILIAGRRKVRSSVHQGWRSRR